MVIALGAAFFAFREIQLIRSKHLLIKRERSWPQFEEAYLSSLQSGISIIESFSFVAELGPSGLESELQELIDLIDNGHSFTKSLKVFRQKVGLTTADLFVEMVLLAHATGGSSLVQALQAHVKEIRFRIAAKGDVESRQSAILSVAKIGLLAPWLLVGVLSINESTRTAFNSVSGQLLLVGGFAISLVAYRLVVAAGALTQYQRIFGANDGKN